MPYRRRAGLFFAIALASMCPVDFASAESSRITIEEIVVTAQKREQDLQSAPVSLAVVPGDLLRRMAVRNSTQLEELIPNLTVLSTRPSQSFPFIRGVGTPIAGLGVDLGVAVYVDGVQIDTPVSNLFSVLDLERVEVLRGPQGTLYGRNAVGGVINLVSKEPDEEFSGRVRAGVGNFGFWEIGASAEGGLVPDVLAGRVGITYQENSEGYFRNNASQFTGENVADNGAQDSATVRGILDYEPAPNLQLALTADYTYTDTSGPATQPLDDVNALAKALALDGLTLPIYAEVDGDVFSLAHNLETLNDTRVYGVGLTIDYSLNERMTLVSITGYRENDIRILEDLDASPYEYLEVASKGDVDQFNQELRLHYSADHLEGVVGLFYTDATYTDQFSVDVGAEFIAAAGGSEPAITQRRAKATSMALFTQWDWSLSGRLTLTLGGRWTDTDKTVSRREYLFSDLAVSAAAAGRERCFVLGPGIGPVDQPECLTTLSIAGQGDVQLPSTVAEVSGAGNWSRFSPKLGVSYDFYNDVMGYASYSQGYRDGGLEGVVAAFREFDEEILHAYEVGIKSDLLDGRLRANGAFFFYDYEDIQLELSQLRNNVVAQSVFNAGEARVKGAELESTWLANDMLQLSVNVGWLDTEITEFDRSEPGIEPGFITVGNELARAPEWTASIVPVLEFPLAVGTVTWRSEFNYNDGFYHDVENGAFADESDALVLTGANIFDGAPPAEAVVAQGTFVYSESTDSRLIVNSMLSFLRADERLEFVLWTRNLFDEEYITDTDFVNGLGYSRATYGAPRTFGVQMNFRY